MNKRFSWSFAIILLVFFISFFVFDSVHTDSKPTVGTAESVIEKNVATLSGKIKDRGGKEISECGFRWGTSQNLDKKETAVAEIDTDEQFSATISGLQAGNTYYYQAYAINSKGLSCGDIKSFTVPENNPPEISITNPNKNLTITKGATVNITAVATDDKNVKFMELYINDNSKIKKNEDSLNYAWNTSGASPGNYTIKATAWDGEKSGKKLVTVTVKEDLKESDTKIIASSQPAIKETINKNTSVSRGADTLKYPKLSKVQGSYGQFYYRDTTGGRIEIDPNWIAENIVTITLPGLNRKVQVHKYAADNFIQAFTYIKNGTAIVNGQKVSLLSLIDTMDGTFVPRHVNWNSSRGLSHHSWGIAIDINAQGHFGYVDPTTDRNDPNLILWEKAFKPAGFSWGNDYSDSMHYELLD